MAGSAVAIFIVVSTLARFGFVIASGTIYSGSFEWAFPRDSFNLLAMSAFVSLLISPVLMLHTTTTKRILASTFGLPSLATLIWWLQIQQAGNQPGSAVLIVAALSVIVQWLLAGLIGSVVASYANDRICLRQKAKA